MSALAFCAVGAERVVSNELRKLGLSVADSGFGRVRFRADTPGLYRALMGLRAADRVLLEAAFFPAEDFDALFEGVRGAPLEEFIPRGRGLVVDKVRSSRSRLKALTSIQAVVHKAAAERLCGRWGLSRLPEGEPGAAELRAYIDKDRVSLLLDLSGEPLFKRGYRVQGGAAPLRESTAAALILLSGWRRKFPLVDPFCGSGTIVIEAALYAWDMAPGLGRSFALSELLPGDPALEAAVREDFLSRVDFSRPMNIQGSDADGRALGAAKANLERAYQLARGQTPVRPPARGENLGALLFARGNPLVRKAGTAEPAAGSSLLGHLPGLPEFIAVSLEEARPRATSPAAGFIVTNPPYGKRLGDPAAAEGLYRDMGKLGRNFTGWKLAVISDHPGFESFFGKKADSCREITNGAVPSFFYQYERL